MLGKVIRLLLQNSNTFFGQWVLAQTKISVLFYRETSVPVFHLINTDPSLLQKNR